MFPILILFALLFSACNGYHKNCSTHWSNENIIVGYLPSITNATPGVVNNKGWGSSARKRIVGCSGAIFDALAIKAALDSCEADCYDSVCAGETIGYMNPPVYFPKEGIHKGCKHEKICEPDMTYLTNPPCVHKGRHQNCLHTQLDSLLKKFHEVHSNEAYSTCIIGKDAITESGGTHPWVAKLVIKPICVDTASSLSGYNEEILKDSVLIVRKTGKVDTIPMSERYLQIDAVPTERSYPSQDGVFDTATFEKNRVQGGDIKKAEDAEKKRVRQRNAVKIKPTQ
jgi:hypothetical protein